MEKKKKNTTSKKANTTKTKKVVKTVEKTEPKKEEVVEKVVPKEVKSAKKSDLSTFKVLALVILGVAILTWFIKPGAWDSTGVEGAVSTFTQGEEPIKIGLHDFFISFYHGISYYVIQLIFLGIIGIFYGVVSKAKGYKVMVKKIASLFKNREVIFTLISSLLIALLASFLLHPIVAIVFIPLLLSIAKELKINKVSAYVSTFGALAIGIMGTTLGTFGLEYLSQGLGTEYGAGMMYRIIILVAGYLAINLFTVLYNKKKNKAEALEEYFEETEDEKGGKAWPYFIIFGLLLVITVLGYIGWNSVLKIDMFDKFHQWLTTELTFGGEDQKFGQLLGSITAFGTWDPYTICYILLITVGIIGAVEDIKKFNKKSVLKLLFEVVSVVGIMIVLAILKSLKLFEGMDYDVLQILLIMAVIALFAIFYKVDREKPWNNILNNALCGLKKMAKPIALVAMAYSVFVLCYYAYANYGSSITATIVNFFNGGDKFNIYFNALGNTIANFLHVDFEYTGFMLGSFYASNFAANADQIMVVSAASCGIVSLIAPTSVIMLTGLSLTKLSYKDYFKAIWKLLLALLIILCLIFTLIPFIK